MRACPLGYNAMAENFFSILKSECINRHKLSSFSQARSLIDEFIWFYNNERIQLSQDHRFNRWLAPP
ncbi:MAG: IS3 family transposase, partial [Massilioclostridium sp.]|nr:IS3 family transposase [Massilioclostridium sp.]